MSYEERKMTEPAGRAEEAGLWRRWRLQTRPAPGSGTADGTLLLAAYAEGRLDDARAEAVEAWLADDPDALSDLIASRAAADPAALEAPEAVLARAAALVQALVQPGAANVFPFPAARRRGWRDAMAWSGIAASILATSLVGFALGNGAYVNLVGQPAAQESMIHELLDPPSGIFTADEEEPAT
jgi:anti-sigma factor RsiW